MLVFTLEIVTDIFEKEKLNLNLNSVKREKGQRFRNNYDLKKFLLCTKKQEYNCNLYKSFSFIYMFAMAGQTAELNGRNFLRKLMGILGMTNIGLKKYIFFLKNNTGF